jgi:hypoxanthine phosphoribosyltransferase
MPKIHNLTYFSIADNVKPKYRQYIQNYLTIKDISSAKILKSIQNGKILIVDDINTSGSTLTEILRIVHNINNNCEIFIFTLIGKE